MNKTFSIIGGDLRIVKLAEMLCEEGNRIKVYGLEKAEAVQKNNSIEKCKSIDECLNESNIVIGSIPFSSNKIDINMPFSDENISIDELMKKLVGKTFIAGSINEELYEKYSDVNIIDIMKREELAVLNTISTAEGAIQIAMEETPKTIHGSKVLVMGFGRIGKMLCNILHGIGAKVYCEARKDSDIAWIKAYGYNAIHLNKLNEKLGDFDIIINTIPILILNETNLKNINKDCLVIDLASAPGGIDRKVAKELGLKAIWALSLPGKVAPITSAEFIKDTIYNIINKEENK